MSKRVKAKAPGSSNPGVATAAKEIGVSGSETGTVKKTVRVKSKPEAEANVKTAKGVKEGTFKGTRVKKEPESDNPEVRSSQRLRNKMHAKVFYLPHVDDLLLTCHNMKIKEAKEQLLAGKLDLHTKSAVLFKNITKPLPTLNYKSLLAEQPINEDKYKILSPGVLLQITKQIQPKIEREINPEWKPTLAKIVERTQLDLKQTDLEIIKEVFDFLRRNPSHETYCVPEAKALKFKYLLEKGMVNDATPENASNVFDPKYRINTPMATIPFREGYGGMDELHVLRDGAPIIWIIFRHEEAQDLVQKCYQRLKSTVKVCMRILEHGTLLVLDEIIRDFDTPCVLVRQEVGDAMCIRSGTYYFCVSLGMNLVESCIFSSPLCLAASSARAKPCGCPDSKSVEIALNHTAKLKCELTKKKKAEGQNSVECPKCTLVCNSLTAVDRHMVEKHGEHYHRCQECSSSFESASKLERHQSTHTGAKVKCEICGGMYANIEKHREVHLPKIKCPKCFQTYAHRVYHDKHKKICQAEPMK